MDIINDGILWQHIINRLKAGFGISMSFGHDIITNGDEILVEDENECDVIADFLETLGFDVRTGYYDPEEDERTGETDENTGYYYIGIE